ncbi:hypothetical protein [Streptomyces sp. TS71-3]|uniref:hypothetical protein n=1 Tax=Streptomyces sp. TS71-3 TaxID=2733862 RepID=UPI001B12C15A|nr:hypothetical protein [Streptomyces sp. TS71-3]GHJ39223.1 hypothetical protein Sm713_48320 [Streptomyces sp. TS71-3]
MPELPLITLGVTALTEGIRFLYGQAGELLRLRRERSGEAGAETATPPCIAEPEALPGADPALVGRFEDDLRALRARLHEYASGIDPVDPADERLLRTVDALRGVIAAVHGTPVVFAGESRDAVLVRGSVDADTVAGYVAAVRADRAAGTIEGTTRVGRVERGGEAVGVDLGTDGSGR